MSILTTITDEAKKIEKFFTNEEGNIVHEVTTVESKIVYDSETIGKKIDAFLKDNPVCEVDKAVFDKIKALF